MLEKRKYEKIEHRGSKTSQRRYNTGLTERIYLRRWQAHQVRQPGINGGCGLLELLLADDLQLGAGGLAPIPVYLTQEAARIAATVIQWLGTNCGLAFIRECERFVKGENISVSIDPSNDDP